LCLAGSLHISADRINNKLQCRSRGTVSERPNRGGTGRRPAGQQNLGVRGRLGPGAFARSTGLRAQHTSGITKQSVRQPESTRRRGDPALRRFFGRTRQQVGPPIDRGRRRQIPRQEFAAGKMDLAAGAGAAFQTPAAQGVPLSAGDRPASQGNHQKVERTGQGAGRCPRPTYRLCSVFAQIL
jgi:hypothetical protein